MAGMARAPRDDVRRVLVVVAHPDDVDFGIAGTVAAWTAAGVEASYCICTSGEAGGFDDTPREDMPLLRQREQRDAAAVVGVHDVTFLGYPDGQLTASIELRRDITREIRRRRPERVVTHSPEIDWESLPVSHPDHRAVGEATVAAVYPDARNRFAHPVLLADGLQPWTVSELWLIAGPTQRHNHVVDVTDTLEAKLAALRAHRSQTAHLDDLSAMVTEQLRDNAARAGLGDGRLAEQFHVVHTD